ncbi:MAG: transposase [Dysgonamonadaceae bacterium]|jgi:transposase|nr:transposase [Dysgonamonadaceae bacterium]
MGVHWWQLYQEQKRKKSIWYLDKCYNKVAESGFKSFNTVAATIYEHYDEILNFFIN